MARCNPLALRLVLVLACLTAGMTGAAINLARPNAVPTATCAAPSCACAPSAAEVAYWEKKAEREGRLERLLTHLVVAGVVAVFILWFISRLV